MVFILLNAQPSRTGAVVLFMIQASMLPTFITKMLVIFIAIIIDLLVAFKIIKKTPLFSASWWHSSKYSRVVQTILLWNTFVFVQIWVVLICLPACMLLLITPLQTLSVLHVWNTSNGCICHSIHCVFTSVWKNVSCQS